MTQHVLTVRLLLESRLAKAWADLLPALLRIELSEVDDRLIDVRPLYARDLPQETEELTNERWRLTYETRRGRATRIAFREDRAPAKHAFEEICAAFETINVFAARARDQEPYHFGLALGAKVVLEELWRREAVLRPALTPPLLATLI